MDLRNLLRPHISIAWLVLTVLTCISLESSRGFLQVHDRHVITAIALLVACYKIRIVILDFMEVRHAPLGLRALLEAWVVLLCVALFGFYWAGG